MELAEDVVRSIVAHLARLRAEHAEVLAAPDLVEPNGEYFPDAFALEPAAIDRLLRRIMTYAPLSTDLGVELGFVEPEGQTGGGGCGSGACGPGGTKDVARGGVVETADGYGVLVHVSDTGDPTLLTTSLTRSVGRLVLFEAGDDVDPRLEGEASELTAVACGLGLLLLNGSCVYKKGCGGMKRHQGTFLGTEELAFALALFVRATGAKPGAVRRHLEVTQREAWDAALAWVDGQPKLVKTLTDAPERLTDGVFTLESKRGLLSRWLRRGEDAALPEAVAVKARKERTEEEARRIAETKALVEEALGGE